MKLTQRIARGLLAGALVLSGTPLAFAQDAPNIDATLDQLLKVDPAELVKTIAALREQAASEAAQAAEFRAQAELIGTQATELETRVNALLKHVEQLNMAFGVAPPPAPAGEMQAAAPAMALTNFDEHIKPIFAQHCASCHNDDQAKGGLSLASFAAAMEGGGSGPVVTKGDPSGSRLLRLVMHEEEPKMPPSGTKIPDEQIELLRRWIADGAPQNKDSAPMAKAEPTAMENGGDAFVAATFADTPPMPEVALASPHALPKRGVIARAIDTSPTAPLLAVGSDRQILLYDLEKLALIGALPFPEGDVFDMTFSVNGEILLAGGGQEGAKGLAVAFNVRTGERLGTFGEYYDTVLAADISPDHRLIALGGPNRKVRVYNVADGSELYVLDKHTDWVTAAKFTPDGEVLTTADRAGNLYMWQAANGRFVEELRGHEGAIHSLAYTNDSLWLASAGADGTVQIWDTWKYNRVRSFKAHEKAVLHVDISADNQILTTSAERLAKVFSLEGQETARLGELADWGYAACFGHKTGQLLTGTWTGEVTVWNAETKEALETRLNTNPGTNTAVAKAK